MRHAIDPSDWVNLLTMKDPLTVVKALQWIRVLKGAYKGELGFVTDVEAWGARVLVVPRLKPPTPQATTSLKRKRTPIKPEPSLFNPATFSTMFQHEPKLHYDGSYTSRGLYAITLTRSTPSHIFTLTRSTPSHIFATLA